MAGSNNLKESPAENCGNGPTSPETLNKSSPKKKCASFVLCLITAFLLMLSAFGYSIYVHATSLSLFEQGVFAINLADIGISESDAQSFANDTIAYLRGSQNVWDPVIQVGDLRTAMPIPLSFKDHMVEVRDWFASARVLLPTCAGIALLLLSGLCFDGKGRKQNRFSPVGYYLGAAIPPILACAIALWAYFDFERLWYILHQAFIPNGIFDIGEPIMQLFPLQLFAGYIQPVCVTFAILAGAVLTLPFLLRPLPGLLADLFHKNSTDT